MVSLRYEVFNLSEGGVCGVEKQGCRTDAVVSKGPAV
jgi:hypothetical protein